MLIKKKYTQVAASVLTCEAQGTLTKRQIETSWKWECVDFSHLDNEKRDSDTFACSGLFLSIQSHLVKIH